MKKLIFLPLLFTSCYTSNPPEQKIDDEMQKPIIVTGVHISNDDVHRVASVTLRDGHGGNHVYYPDIQYVVLSKIKVGDTISK